MLVLAFWYQIIIADFHLALNTFQSYNPSHITVNPAPNCSFVRGYPEWRRALLRSSWSSGGQEIRLNEAPPNPSIHSGQAAQSERWEFRPLRGGDSLVSHSSSQTGTRSFSRRALLPGLSSPY